ncbi:MAG: phospholipase D-like domain-containing protein [Bacteroidales bacterium]
MTTGTRTRPRAAALIACALGVLMFPAGTAQAADQIYFPAVTDTVTLIVNRINAETVRVDVSAWYLTEHAISQALVGRLQAGVQVRVIGDRASIFEIDPNTKTEFYYLANAGVPIRLRYNPNYFPEIDHMKMAYFKGQGVVEFGSANWTTYQLKPASSTNFSDETVMFTDDPVLVGAFATRFDIIWNDTTNEPLSQYGGAPYLKNWYDACALESACSDFSTTYPNPAPMSINTGRLEPNNPYPSDLIWGQGSVFNNRLITEINNELTKVRFVVYRLTEISSIADALLSKFQSGVPVQVILEPSEYLNRKWPEFELTHANIDRLWAAGIPIKIRTHQGVTHMKMLVTSNYATNASSNYAVNWQRDNDYFVSATNKPTIYSAMSNRFDIMWNDTTNFGTFTPQPPDTPIQAVPANGAGSVSQTPTLTWNRAVFATSYDVYLGTSSSNMSFVGNVPAQLNPNPPSTYSWTSPSQLAGGTTYYWKVVARTNATVKNSSLVGVSATWSFTTGGSGGGTPPPSSNVPSPWATSDIGSVGLAGSASYSNGVFTVAGAGSDIWGTSDSFRYVYQTLSGDGQIVARVTSEQNTSTNAKAGVMLRESLASNATNVILDVSPTGNIEFMVRSSTGASTTWLAGATQAFPAWLKLVRSGSTVTGYVSSNGSTWSTVGSTSVTMASSAYMGLPVNSHNTSALNTSTFDNVSVAAGSTTPPPPPPPSGLPSPWQNGDVGTVGQTGSASYSNGVFTVSGAGSDIWGTSDSFQFVDQPISGDAQIVARVTSETNTSTYAKAGVMLRASTASNAANVILDVSPSGNIEFMVRSSTGASTVWLAGATQSIPAWLKLARSGNTVTGYVSADGNTWTTVGSTTLSIASSALVGMAVTSHNTSLLNTSTFDNVTVTASAAPPPSSLPSPWANTDVGAVGATGSASYSNGVTTVSGAGSDIWGTSDSFQFVYKPIAGDGQLVARVTSEQNTNTYAKAGVILRESTAANAAEVILDVTPSGNVEFMVRSSTGASMVWLAGTTQAFPAWLKLVRSGTTVTGYVSADGATWSTVGTTTLSIATNAYLGLAVTSHNTSVLNTSTFDNVQ